MGEIVWVKQALQGVLAKAIRKDNRLHRPRDMDGHRFRFDDLSVLWLGNDNHIVFTLSGDAVWQYWTHNSDVGWHPVSWHFTRREAQVAAESPPPPKKAPTPPRPGIWLVSSWAVAPYATNDPDRKPMRVHCSTDSTARVLTEIFGRLGCQTRREVVA